MVVGLCLLIGWRLGGDGGVASSIGGWLVLVCGMQWAWELLGVVEMGDNGGLCFS